MIRVLHSAGDMLKGGGIEAFLMNIYRNIDREKEIGRASCRERV